MQMYKRNKGITLVALIITIIILLILAGVSLSFVFNGGILDKAQSAVNEYENVSQKEKEMLDKIDKYIENELVSNTDDNIEQTEGLIIDLVKPGDYIEYNPTILNKDGTQVDENKLTYTSPKGTIPVNEGEIITHGNGNSEQTFTADDTVKWQILNVDKTTGVVEIIAENPIKTDLGGNFILEGGIGYLYAEEELARICSIYGYGYGADTTIGANYTVGGPEDTTTNGKIEGTGARSVNINDINKLRGVYTEDDLKELYPNYGNSNNPKNGVRYPTLTSNNTTNPGMSNDVKAGFINKGYNIHKNLINNETVREILYNGNFWISSRVILADEYNASFNVRYIDGITVLPNFLCVGYNNSLSQKKIDEHAVKPIVTLKKDLYVKKIDNSNSTWILN